MQCEACRHWRATPGVPQFILSVAINRNHAGFRSRARSDLACACLLTIVSVIARKPARVPARKLLMAGMDVRSIADDKRPYHVAVMPSWGQCTRLTILRARFNASLAEARPRQRYRPEDRTGE